MTDSIPAVCYVWNMSSLPFSTHLYLFGALHFGDDLIEHDAHLLAHLQRLNHYGLVHACILCMCAERRHQDEDESMDLLCLSLSLSLARARALSLLGSVRRAPL